MYKVRFTHPNGSYSFVNLKEELTLKREDAKLFETFSEADKVAARFQMMGWNPTEVVYSS